MGADLDEADDSRLAIKMPKIRADGKLSIVYKKMYLTCRTQDFHIKQAINR